jgi:hypothetical protein
VLGEGLDGSLGELGLLGYEGFDGWLGTLVSLDSEGLIGVTSVGFDGSPQPGCNFSGIVESGNK